MPVAMLDWLLDPWTSDLVISGALTAVLAGTAAAAVGSWVVLRDLPYAAESLSHGMFPGIVAATLVGAPIAAGGLLGLALAGAAIAFATKVAPNLDTATAIAITPLTGLGALLALAGPLPPGAGEALFGDVLGTAGSDVIVALAALVFVAVVLRAAHWRLLDSGLTDTGSSRADAVVLVLLAVATAAAAGSLGALLTVSLVIGPAAAARRLATRAAPMIAVSAGISIAAVAAGVELSWHFNLATGPTIAICAIIPGVLIAMLNTGVAAVRRLGAAK